MGRVVVFGNIGFGLCEEDRREVCFLGFKVWISGRKVLFVIEEDIVGGVRAKGS